ncbi:phosphate acyltransferase PlsX [Alteromonas sp. 5E99-2]|uniref:phosphate acyltransferase PlsX n=1 Tax=Alteromonas sp. 5E99-2 TaxID=2817683 RepID=UPI001A9A2B08|nr:phosphate acyltransferase PlsX [Alteromonas sp. 5E99-2]MBO1254959.1 phosphate acyltransferase PlsX [Alteromonas sp. 5E99-2]
MTSLTIALDMMGGDNGPSSTIPAAIRAAIRYKNIHFLLYGDSDTISYQLDKHADNTTKLILNRLEIRHCSESVEMTDKPSSILRNKKDASMRRMLESVASKTAQGCVSAGNTGALFALAYYLIKTHEGIDRPALVSALPTAKQNRVFLLDLGANVNCNAETLFQYGVMGSVLAEHVAEIPKPRVALLNVGEEDIKGNAQVKSADQLLRASESIHYVGYVEGDDLFTDVVDVVVTDGFTGNIALKSTEGLAKLIINEVKHYSERNLLTRVTARLALPLLKKIYNRVNPDQYNGASLIGLRGTVIKSHGNASSEAFFYAIQRAIDEASNRVPEKIKTSIETVMLEQL